jgi:fibrillarin-like rRNA methylase
MRRAEVLQEVRKMRFEKAYRGWQKGRSKVHANLLKFVGVE